MIKEKAESKALRVNHRFCVFTILVSQLMMSIASAQVIPTYFGWDLTSYRLTKAREVLQLKEIGYVGESNLEDFPWFPSMLLRTPMPNFPGFDVGFGTGIVFPSHDGPFQFQGMPDVVDQTVGIGPPSGTGATFSNGGDGETTRTIGAAVSIDWVPAGVPTPWGTLPFPSIGLVEIETVSYGFYDPFGFDENDFIRTPDATPEIGNAGAFGPAYGVVLGLIPFGVHTELDSGLSVPQDDIYNNPVQTFFSGLGEQSARFSAAVVPLPAAFWLFGTGLLSLIGIARRKKA